MSAARWLPLVILLSGCAVSNDKGPVPEGKAQKTESAPQDTAATLNLAKLGDADRDAAQTQKFCAVHGDSQLGSMGVPVKITLKNKDGAEVTAFLCCKACEKAARQDEAKTAATVAQLNVTGNLAKLSDDDRDDAVTQKFCAVHGDSLLGSMGVPVKITIKNKDGDKVGAFLCCKACEKTARQDEAKTAAVVEELNIASNLAKLAAEDRTLAQAQKFCAVATESRLGSMGPPEKYIIKDKDGVEHPVFVCCGGCIRTIKRDEAKTLRDVAELKKKNVQAGPK
jgi:hypothetical protein